MSINRSSLMIAVLTVLVLAFSSLAAPLRVGVTQIVEHPALDAARQGFIDRLAELGYEEGTDVVYDIQSAQGDFGTALTIAQKFAADGVDLVLAIATPAAQAAAQVLRDTPILITAVTDPVAAELVDSIERPGTNVTGTSDLTPVRAQLELLTMLAPSARRVGVIYNAGEVNSVVQVNLAKAAAADLGLEVVEATAANSSEVLSAAQSLVGRVDALYVPTDNTVVSAIESVVLVAERARLPLIAGEDLSVEQGALATVGIDYYQLGRQTADMALRVLQGENPAEMSIEYQNEINLVVNLSAAQRMGVTIPEDLLANAARVID
ncbi:MAG: sugar ABC transporter substrate-binding protein [Bacillota bacterium]|nr:MAG: sugar ABC transporter substrate-binding protein [Bacillota bacterium]